MHCCSSVFFVLISCPSGGHSSCEFLECDYAPSTNLAEFFSNNGDVWMDIFAVAYDKMVTTVAEDIKQSLRSPTESKQA